VEESERQEVTVKLFSNETHDLHSASLIIGLTEPEMDIADKSWQEFQKLALAEAIKQGFSVRDLPEHRHWDWKAKVREATPDDRFFGVLADNQTQGMMIAKQRKTCRLEVQKNLPLVYVDYVSTAPWNLHGFVAEPRFRGAGRILIAAAVEWSKSLGCQGRLGLHALPQAEGFYEKSCHMTRIGRDENYENLAYFEMTSEQAVAFLATRPKGLF
jgi:GNAT superfamily N-acetyltransferase